MGLNYRKRIRIIKGVNLNVSKSGIGLNIGRPGANVTFNKKGTTVNYGIPGTGIYGRKTISSNSKNQEYNRTDSEIINENPLGFIILFISLFLGVAIPLFFDGSWWCLLILPLIGFVITVAMSLSKQNEPPSYTSSEVVTTPDIPTNISRHKQIMDESIKIMESTNNLQTLLSRYNTLVEHYGYVVKAIDSGVNIQFNTDPEGFIPLVNKTTNELIKGIFEFRLEAIKANASKLSMIKADNIKEECVNALKEHQNKAIVKSSIEAIYFKSKKTLEGNLLLQSTADLNNKGIELEKMGNIDDAIQTYNECVDLGYPAHHSYKRLMVLYRKNKDYSNELRIIETALVVFPQNIEYSDRLNKVKQLIAKNN